MVSVLEHYGLWLVRFCKFVKYITCLTSWCVCSCKGKVFVAVKTHRKMFSRVPFHSVLSIIAKILTLFSNPASNVG